jgi:hypothetical protein
MTCFGCCFVSLASPFVPTQQQVVSETKCTYDGREFVFYALCARKSHDRIQLHFCHNHHHHNQQQQQQQTHQVRQQQAPINNNGNNNNNNNINGGGGVGVVPFHRQQQQQQQEHAQQQQQHQMQQQQQQRQVGALCYCRDIVVILSCYAIVTM